jgi:hypothetical protein
MRIQTVRLCLLLLGRHVVVLVWPRTVQQGKPGSPRKGQTLREKARTVRLCQGASIYQEGMTVEVFALDMSSSAYHIMVGAANPHLLLMY